MSDRLGEAIGTVLVNTPRLVDCDLEEIDMIVWKLTDLFESEDPVLDDDWNSPTYNTYVEMYRLKV